MGTCGDYDTYQEQDEQVSKKWRPELIQDEMKQKNKTDGILPSGYVKIAIENGDL